MKKFLLIPILLSSQVSIAYQMWDQDTSISTTAPNASARLDVSSTTKGFLPPRMTSAQRLAISSPAAGLQVFDTDLNDMMVYDGTIWTILGLAGGGFSEGAVIFASDIGVITSDPPNFFYDFTNKRLGVGGAGASAPTVSLDVFGDGRISGDLEMTSLSPNLPVKTSATSSLVTGKINMASEVTSELGVPNGGTGTSTPPTDGDLLIGSNDGTYALAKIQAVSNQTTVTNGSSSITVGTAQDISASSSPSFADLDVNYGGTLSLYDNSNSGSIGIRGPPSVTESVTYTLPEDGDNGQFLSTDGAGGLSWVAGSANDPLMLSNLGLSVLAASSTLSIDITQANGVIAPTATDPVRIAFSGKGDTVESGETAANDFTTKDLLRSVGGSPTGTLFGVAAISATSTLEILSGAGAWRYDPTSMVGSDPRIGTIRLKYTPNYSGSPATNMVIYLEMATAGSTANMIRIRHLTTGAVTVETNNASNVAQTTLTAVASWSPTAGQTYEFEYNFDYSGGTQRLFIDGTVTASTGSVTCTRDTSITLGQIGDTGVSQNFTADDYQRFTEVRHTSNFTGEVPRSITTGYADKGGYDVTTIEDTINITLPTGATLGLSDSATSTVWVYAIRSDGSAELAVSATRYSDEAQLISTTVLNASSTDTETIYSDTARTDVPFRLIGRMEIFQTTAGEWDTAPDIIYAGQNVPVFIAFTSEDDNYVLKSSSSTPYVQKSGVSIDGSENMTGVNALSATSSTIGNIGTTANTISSTSGDIVLDPTDEISFSFGASDLFVWKDRTPSLTLRNNNSGAAFSFEIFSFDGDGTDPTNFKVFGAGTPSDVSSSHYLGMLWDSSNSRYALQSVDGGAGSAQPLAIRAGTGVNQILLHTDGDISFGTTTAAIDKVEIAGDLGMRSQGKVKFYDSSTNAITFSAPSSATPTDYVWPDDDGNSGQILKTDGSGNLDWVTQSALVAQNNFLINSNGAIWQRSSSSQPITDSAAFLNLDRWVFGTNSAANFTHATSTPGGTMTDVNGVTQPAMQINLNAANGSAIVSAYQTVVAPTAQQLAGQAASMSFEFINEGFTTITVTLSYASSTDNFAGAVEFASSSQVFATSSTVQEFTYENFSVPAGAADGILVGIALSGVTQGSDTDNYLTKFMLNPGASAQEWLLAGRSEAGEQKLCEAFYRKSYTETVNPGSANSRGAITAATMDTNLAQGHNWGEQMYRAPFDSAPTITIYNPATGTAGEARGTSTGNNISVSVSDPGTAGFRYVNGGSLSTERVYYHYTAEAEPWP